MKRGNSVSLHFLLLPAAFLTALLMFILPVSTAKAAVVSAPAVTATASGNKVTVSATSVAGANKYRYQISLNSSFTNIVETKSKAKLSIKFTDLDYNTTYYVRARGFYKADGSKEFGPWSSVVTVTTGNQTAAAPAPAVKVKSYILNNDILSLLGMSMDQVKSKYASVTTVKVGSVSGMNTIGLGNPAIELYFTNKGCFFLAGNLSTLVGKTVPQLNASKLLDELGINAGYIGECQEIKEADPKKSVLTIYYQRNYGTDSGTLYIYGVSKDSSGNIIYDGSSVIRIVEGITNFSTVGGGYSNMFGGYLAAG